MIASSSSAATRARPEEEKKQSSAPARRPLEWFDDLEDTHFNPYRDGVDPDSDSELSGLEDFM